MPTQAEVVLHEDISGYEYSQLAASDASAAAALLAGAPEIEVFKTNKSKLAEYFRNRSNRVPGIRRPHHRHYSSLEVESARPHTHDV